MPQNLPPFGQTADEDASVTQPAASSGFDKAIGSIGLILGLFGAVPLFFRVESTATRIAVLVICGCLGGMTLAFVRALAANRVHWPFAVSSISTVIALIVTVYLAVDGAPKATVGNATDLVTPIDTPYTASSTPGPTPSMTTEATVGPTSSTSPTEGPSAPASTSPEAGVTYLSSLKPVSDGNNYAGVKSAHVDGKLYPDTANMGCGESSKRHVEWNAAGQGRFDATLAIDDDDPQGSRVNIIVEFLDHTGKALHARSVVALGSPQRISIPLNGSLRLRLNCQAEERTRTGNFVHANLFVLEGRFTATSGRPEQ